MIRYLALGASCAAGVSALALSPKKQLVVRHAKPEKEAQPARKRFELELGNYQNVQYFANITIGEQRMPAIYDTGSFEILTLSVRCPKCKLHASKKSPLYDHVVSSSYVGEGTRVEHVFGSGPVVSQRGFENIMIGDSLAHPEVQARGFASQGPVLKKMDFWQIEDHQIGAWEAGARFSAIVGLGPRDTVPPLTKDQQDHPTPTLLQRSGIDEFSICLQRKHTVAQVAANPARQFPPGWLAFNAPPSKKADSKVEVVGQVHWGVKMGHFGISGDPSKTNVCKGGCGAIVDSGTSLIAAPKEVLMQMDGFLSQVRSDCSNIDQLPNLEFTLGSGEKAEHFSLPPKAYVMKVTSADVADSSIWDWVMGTPKVKIVNSCMPAFMPLDKHSQFGPVFILGMPFLRYFKTTFVRTTPPQMYFDAVDKHCAPLPESAAPPSGSAKPTDGPGSAANPILLGLKSNLTKSAVWTNSLEKDDFAYEEVDLNELVRPKWVERKDFVF